MKNVIALLTLFTIALTASSQACAVCAGGDDQNLIDASNAVLWSLLGLVAFIFAATGATVFYLWKKSANRSPLNQPETLTPAEARN